MYGFNLREKGVWKKEEVDPIDSIWPINNHHNHHNL